MKYILLITVSFYCGVIGYSGYMLHESNVNLDNYLKSQSGTRYSISERQLENFKKNHPDTTCRMSRKDAAGKHYECKDNR